MRTAWATFAKDPEKGLAGLGWPEYSSDGNTLVRLAYNDTLGPNLDQGDAYDKSCRGMPDTGDGGGSGSGVGSGTSATGSANATKAAPAGSADGEARPEFLPPIPLSWYSLCVTGYWMGYFCVL
jgi:cholinesterase